MWDVSVVIAAYNDARILEHGVEEVLAVLRGTRLTYELVFVDDASQDDTVRVIDACRRRYAEVPSQLLVHVSNQGRGRTVADGFRVARGRIIGYLDIDLEVHARYLPAMVDAIDRLGFDAAIAWRIYKLTWSGFLRAACSKGYLSLVRGALGLPFKDTETGFKFFRREALQRVIDHAQHPGWFWDTELMAYCVAEGLRVAELPCLFLRRADKHSSVRLVRDSVEYLRALRQFRRRWRSIYRQPVSALAATSQAVECGTTPLDHVNP